LKGACVLLDIGANVDVKPEWLAQFALMGSLYAEIALGRQRPSVATLSNGEEEGKGNALLSEAVPLIRALPLNYVGNVEGKDVTAGVADVVVVDGFAGNIFLKGAEGVVATMTELIRRELTRTPLRAVLALGLRPAFRAIRQRLSYEEVGGVPLLGVNGVCIVAHGRSTPYAMQNAIRAAAQCVELRLVDRIREGMAAESSPV
ncbi:MAG TPA: phosphate--acyl-ACP acyltransferase, partial [Chloroflexota bacterium]